MAVLLPEKALGRSFTGPAPASTQSTNADGTPASQLPSLCSPSHSSFPSPTSRGLNTGFIGTPLGAAVVGASGSPKVGIAGAGTFGMGPGLCLVGSPVAGASPVAGESPVAGASPVAHFSQFDQGLAGSMVGGVSSIGLNTGFLLSPTAGALPVGSPLGLSIGLNTGFLSSPTAGLHSGGLAAHADGIATPTGFSGTPGAWTTTFGVASGGDGKPALACAVGASPFFGGGAPQTPIGPSAGAPQTPTGPRPASGRRPAGCSAVGAIAAQKHQDAAAPARPRRAVGRMGGA